MSYFNVYVYVSNNTDILNNDAGSNEPNENSGGSGESGKITASKLSVELEYESYMLIAGGQPVYNKAYHGGIYEKLVRDEEISYEDYRKYEEQLTGIMYITRNGNTYSDDLKPRYEMGHVYYDRTMFVVDSGTKIEWKFPNGAEFNIDGEYTVPESIKKDDTFEPYVKLTEDGINVSKLEWYFVDSNGTKIDTPSDITDINVEIFSRAWRGNQLTDSTQGYIDVNMPSIYINSVAFTFKRGELNYRWYFSPVDKPSYNNTEKQQ